MEIFSSGREALKQIKFLNLLEKFCIKAVILWYGNSKESMKISKEIPNTLENTLKRLRTSTVQY